MAILQVGSAITATNGSTASTTLTSASYSVANNEVAIIAIQLPDTGAVSSISDSASRSWTFINAANHSGGDCRVEYWRYVNTSGSTKTGTTTITTASNKKTFVIGIYSGVNTSDPVGTTGTTGGAQNTSPTVSINMNAGNSWMFGTYSTDGTPTFTTDSTDTLVGQNVTSGQGASTNVRGVLVRDNNVTSSAGTTLTTTGTWSGTVFWVAGAIELREATSGETTSKSTTAVLTDLEKPQKSTTAVLTTLEKSAQYSTVGVLTTLEEVNLHPITITSQVNTTGFDGYDDGTWRPDGDANKNNFINDSGPSNAGLIFPNISIPKGSKITNAKITVHGYGSGNAVRDLHIRAFAEDNAPAFLADGSNKPSTRTKTTATVTWSENFPFAYADRVSPDISSVVQAVTDRSGWTSGNNLGFNITPANNTGEYLAFRDYAGDTARSARISISYIPPGSTVAVLTELEAAPAGTTGASTVSILTDLEKSALSTTAVLTTLEKSLQSSTVAINATLEKPLKSTVSVLSTLEKPQRSTVGVLATLEKTQNSTTAILTTLEANRRSTTAMLTTLEKSAQYSTTAILTVLEKSDQKSTVAVLTTLEKPSGNTIAILTTLERVERSTTAIFTDLVGNKASATAVLTILEKTPANTVAVLTTLEKPQQSTTGVLTTLEKAVQPSTVSVLSILEKTTNYSTVGVLITLEKPNQSTVAVFAELEKTTLSTTAIFTELVGNPRSTVGVLTVLEKTQNFSTVGVSTTLERIAQSTVAVVTTLEQANQNSTTAIFTTLERPVSNTIAILTTLEKSLQTST